MKWPGVVKAPPSRRCKGGHHDDQSEGGDAKDEGEGEEREGRRGEATTT